MRWQMSHRADPLPRALADRHYNRQRIGAKGFVPPGRCLVLYAPLPTGAAFWVTSWPFAEYAQHAWGGAWICSAFRNESQERASGLITEAVKATRFAFGPPPAEGLVTFIDRQKVRPVCVRGRKTWGRTYELAGFREVGMTKAGLLVFQLAPCDMPEPELPGFDDSGYDRLQGIIGRRMPVRPVAGEET
jgi:hypothetical protein